MNNKKLIQVAIAIVVALVGWWQTREPSRPVAKQSTESALPSASPMSSSAVGTSSPSSPSASAKQNSGLKFAPASELFDYYVASYSWSPSYCALNPNDKRQCGGKGFGFILHGLWPQKSAGGYPEDCPLTAKPTQAAIQKALAFMPSERLIQHEWKKHGTCTGLTGDEYLALADKAYSVLKIPNSFEAPSNSRDMSVREILSEFAKANPNLPSDSLVVKCSGAELQEVRLCLDPQLNPRSCGKGVRNQCRKGDIQVRSVR